MTTSAVVMMVVMLTLFGGGFAALLTLALCRERQEKRDGNRVDPRDDGQ